MINNTPPPSASPGSAAIRPIVADLERKSITEEERISELERLLSEARSRRDRLTNTILGLRSEYKLDETDDSEQDAAATPLPPLNQQPDESGIDTPHVAPATAEQGHWIKPNVLWLELIREALRKMNNLGNQQEIMEALQMDDVAKKAYSSSLSGALTSYRGTGQLIGVQVYQRTSMGKAISYHYTGLPDFFEDIEARSLKAEYETRFKDKVRAQGFYLSEVEAIRSKETTPSRMVLLQTA